MKTRLCPHCGRPYPPLLHVTGNVRRQIVDIVAGSPNGIERERIIWKVYGHDPNGGPLSPNVVSVHIWNANKQLRPQGYKIVGDRGRGSLYRLVKTDAPPKRKPDRAANDRSVEGHQPASDARHHR